MVPKDKGAGFPEVFADVDTMGNPAFFNVRFHLVIVSGFATHNNKGAIDITLVKSFYDLKQPFFLNQKILHCADIDKAF